MQAAFVCHRLEGCICDHLDSNPKAMKGGAKRFWNFNVVMPIADPNDSAAVAECSYKHPDLPLKCNEKGTLFYNTKTKKFLPMYRSVAKKSGFVNNRLCFQVKGSTFSKAVTILACECFNGK